jgi:hypothetical protein
VPALLTEKDGAGLAPKNTALTLHKPVPWITTVPPPEGDPLLGELPETVGDEGPWGGIAT